MFLLLVFSSSALFRTPVIQLHLIHFGRFKRKQFITLVVQIIFYQIMDLIVSKRQRFFLFFIYLLNISDGKILAYLHTKYVKTR